jgi:putative oxidoreductase
MRNRLAPFAPVPLRLMMGIGFVVHGWPKLFSATGHEAFVGSLGSLGVPLPHVLGWVVGVAEVGGAVMLLAGAYVAPVSAALIVEMLVALFLVHGPQGFNVIHITHMTPEGPQFGLPGYEFNLLYLAILAALLLGGAGGWSVDRWRARTWWG